eukprot:scaffold113115_cov21-Tisochrysis_lutea.AAC.1
MTHWHHATMKLNFPCCGAHCWPCLPCGWLQACDPWSSLLAALNLPCWGAHCCRASHAALRHGLGQLV